MKQITKIIMKSGNSQAISKAGTALIPVLIKGSRKIKNAL